MTGADLERYLGFAHTLADIAGAAVLPHFRTRPTVTGKAGGRNFDPVTDADRDAERAMRERIAATFPEHGIWGEEFGEQAGASRLRWVLDPIDGTRAFICGLPLWGTLIALCDGDEPLLGCMDQPWLGERFTGSRLGARMRDRGGDRPLATRPCERLADAVLFATDPAMFRREDEWERFRRVAAAARLTRYGGDCYAYCMLAAGHIDLVVEADLKLYDLAALVPIIEAAGGRITDWQGRRDFTTGRIVVAGDARVHEAALALLA